MKFYKIEYRFNNGSFCSDRTHFIKALNDEEAIRELKREVCGILRINNIEEVSETEFLAVDKLNNDRIRWNKILRET